MNAAFRACLSAVVLATAVRAEDIPLQSGKWALEPTFSCQTNALHFASSRPGFASIPWNAGDGPFALAWEVEIERGSAQAWRYPGVCLGVSTAPPAEMDANTVTLVFAAQLDGVCATVRRGKLFEPNRNKTSWPPPFSNMTDADLSRRYDLNQHGAGGRWYSIQWPNTDLDGTRLAFRIERTGGGLLRFSVFHSDYEEGREPWWQKDWPLPPELARLRFTTIVAKTTISPEDYRSPGKTPEGGVVAGRIVNLRGWLGEAAAAAPAGFVPVTSSGRTVLRAEPRESLPAGGDWVTVYGSGFEEDCGVFFGDQPAAAVERLDAERLRARVPAGRAGPAAVTVKKGTEAWAGEAAFGYAPHPYLYFKEGDLPDLRRKFNEPAFAGYRALLLQNAGDVPAGGEETEKSGRGGIIDLLWAYVFSGEVRYRDRLYAVLDKEARSISHEEFRMMAAHDVAVAYDALFAELPLELRIRLERYLERAARVYVRNVKKRRWWYAQNISNTIAVGGAGGGGTGLALLNSTPVAREAAELAGKTVAEWYRPITPDGGCVEGTLYWNYGLTAYLRLGHMLANATGSDAGLLDTAGLRNNVRFVETQLGGDDRFFTFNDTQPWLTGLAVCADLGSRFNQPLMLWMADYMAGTQAAATNRPSEISRGDVAAYAFLWRSRESAPAAFPGVPLAAKLDVMQWGVLRSDSNHVPALVCGIKGQGGPVTHHAQEDAGSFVVQAGGESFLIDPGYYQPRADAHSLPLIDGEGPVLGKDWVKNAPLSEPVVEGGKRRLSVDSTACYKTSKAKRVRRHVVMIGAQALVVLDDIEAAGRITSRFQCGFKPRLEGDEVLLAGKNGGLRITWHGPAVRASTEGPFDFGRSWVFKRLAEKGLADWHALVFDYVPDPERPLVTILTPDAGNGKNELATVIFGKDRIGVRLDNREVAVFVKKRTGWEPVPEERKAP